jgi:hypothetical protein
MEAPGMTKQRLIQIIVCIEVVLVVGMVWVALK